MENEKSHLETAMKDVNDVLRDERKKMEDIFDNMKEELKSNMQMNEVCYHMQYCLEISKAPRTDEFLDKFTCSLVRRNNFYGFSLACFTSPKQPPTKLTTAETVCDTSLQKQFFFEINKI